MDTRRKRNQTATEEPKAEPAVPPTQKLGSNDNAEIHRKLDALLAEQHELRRLMHRMTVPVETLNLRETARRLSRSTKWVRRIQAKQVFTDGRPPELRVAGADLVFYADEIDVYRTDGEKGVARLRRELGRN